MDPSKLWETLPITSMVPLKLTNRASLPPNSLVLRPIQQGLGVPQALQINARQVPTHPKTNIHLPTQVIQMEDLTRKIALNIAKVQGQVDQ